MTSSSGHGTVDNIEIKTDPRALLEIENLTLTLVVNGHKVALVRNLSMVVNEGVTLGLVGESGSGKSITCRAILGMLPRGIKIESGAIRWLGNDLVVNRAYESRGLRGGQIGMVFQDASTALNPVMTIGDQIVETLRTHRPLDRAEAKREAENLLDRVGIPSARARLASYPHELSGGMRQRVMIAIAISCRPKLLIADEPTTNLDATIQDQILGLLGEIQEEYNASMILVSHDLGVVAQFTDYVSVMYAGAVMESGPTGEMFSAAHHPYTRGLIKVMPSLYRQHPGRRLPFIPGQLPSLFDAAVGCPFRFRCEGARAACESLILTEIPVVAGHVSACPFPIER